MRANYRLDEGAINLSFPTYSDTIISGIEILNKSSIDTFFVDSVNDPYAFYQQQQYTLTSFDSGVYVLPEMSFVMNGEALTSRPMAIQVATIQVDTTKGIVDIVLPEDVPVTLSDYVKVYQSYIYWILGVIIILVLLWVLYKKLKRKQLSNPVKKQAPALPPHVIAIQKLRELEQKNYFVKNKSKQHYVEITNILREYFEMRFEFLAMEYTSQEIIQHVKLYGWETRDYDGLKRLLNLADLVKFAKAQPKESDVAWSFEFVEELILATKPVEKEEEEDEDTTNA